VDEDPGQVSRGELRKITSPERRRGLKSRLGTVASASPPFPGRMLTNTCPCTALKRSACRRKAFSVPHEKPHAHSYGTIYR
jgi:hypothetical protein